MAVDRKSAARVLRETARLMELHGENQYRVRAFGNAARAVERIDGELSSMIDSGEILEIKGIGKGVAAVLGELAAGREPEVLSELERRTPDGVREMLEVSGLGPKKVRTLWTQLEVVSLGELEYACMENRLVDLPGFGTASQEGILEAVRYRLSAGERRLVHQAWADADALRERLTGSAGIEAVHPAGELRRGTETVGVIDLVVVAQGDGASADIEAAIDGAIRTEDGGWEGRSDGGLPVRLRIARARELPAAIIWATGPSAHVDELQARARMLGRKLDERGVWNGDDLVPCDDESSLYEALGCQPVPPELRSGRGEVAAAAAGDLPELLRLQDLQGALHNHTTDSDGRDPMADMARAAADMGWSYFGVADHSPVARYANGLSGDRLRGQWQVVDELNGTGTLPRVVKGLEADILSDGGLDIPEGCASGLEYVVASVHSGFRLSVEAQTDRIIAAVRDPSCRILGHPTGRLLLARPGYDVDLDRVLDACAEARVAVEINASPYRLDLDARWARRAIDRGVMLAINPDAHSVDGLGDVRWGVSVARRAGATARQVVNCGDIEDWLARTA